MRRGFRISILFAIVPLILSFAGCEKKTGVAIVLEKEHIAAKPADEKPENAATPASSETPTVEERELSANEITVDQYVMDRDVRGTDRDPRAMNHEQWIVKVRMTNGRQFNVQADQLRWKKLEEGDRVFVTYRQGKYTGTVWDSKIR
jgi:hypothetical protein